MTSNQIALSNIGQRCCFRSGALDPASLSSYSLGRFHVMIDYEKLIPELREWNNGLGIGVEPWISCSGSFQLAVGYTALYWPRFVEFEGYVLREGFSADSFRGFRDQCTGSRRDLEAVMNHLHIAAVHCCDLNSFTAEHALYLGRALRVIYQAKLAWQFPSRKFEVVFDESTKSDLMGYEITFFQPDSTANSS